MAGKRGRPRKYLKKGIPHKLDHYGMVVKGYYFDLNDKKTRFQYPVFKSVNKDSVLDMITRDKGIDIYDVMNLTYAIINNKLKPSPEE